MPSLHTGCSGLILTPGFTISTVLIPCSFSVPTMPAGCGKFCKSHVNPSLFLM